MRTKARFAAVVTAVALVLGSVATLPAGAADRQAAPTRTVQVYPSPGTPTVSPKSQLSFRGSGTSPISGLQVVGSVTGAHPGRWIAHSDGNGTSFVPASPFRPGERVAVTTGVNVVGATDGRFNYQVSVPASGVPRPGDTLNTAGTDEADASAASAPQSRISGSLGTPTPVGPSTYRSRPDLTPPKINTTVGAGAAPGLLFATANVPAFSQTGNIIYDNTGSPVWFRPQEAAASPFNLQPINYRGTQALSFFQGFNIFGGAFAGEWVVLDSSYRDIGRVRAGNGYAADIHELAISPTGDKALVDIYAPVRLDLTQYGGKPDATYLEGVIQEIDLATGAVTFEWHSLTPGHIAVDENLPPFPVTTQLVDGPHINSVGYDTDGNILVSARHISTVFKMDRSSGATIWRLGGKKNQFTFTDGDGGPSFQHDARRRPDGTVSVYDNGLGRSPQYGRGVAFNLDEVNKTASVNTEWRHNPDVFGPIVGDTRRLANGNQLVSFGNTGNVTEFGGAGTAFESQLAAGVWTYRTFRAPWQATPTEPPAVAIKRSAGGVGMYVSWNGATDVASWELLGGPDQFNLRVMNSGPRTGFETQVSAFVSPTDRVFKARARNGSGQQIGISGLVLDPIETKYAALGRQFSFLGSSVGGEFAAGPYGIGLGQDYQAGTIFWRALVGAYEVHGAIRNHYRNDLGGTTSFLGFPTTDETATPDGIGRFNHFQHGSIYWTPSTGAFEVHGAIRNRWASLGFERGQLGYPVSDEFTPSPGFRRSNFQGGYIVWTASTGQTQIFYT